MKRGRKTELSTMRPVLVRDQLKLDLPPPPEHLTPATKLWWAAIVAEFDFAPHQLRTLQAAAESWDRTQQARAELTKHGLTFTDAKGMIRTRPEHAIERDSRNGFLRAMKELDLSDEAPEQTYYDIMARRNRT